jgi:Ca2+-transporting ATPase
MSANAPLASGLTEAEARARLARDGPNRLPSARHKTLPAAILSAAAQPMVLLLLACTAVYAVLGSAFDSAVLSVSIVVVAGISVYQELRTQRVLESLRALASPRSTVVRDGVVKRIPSHELVVGDRLIVHEGDRLACDACLLEAHSMRIDESLLTGESMLVDKRLADPRSAAAPAATDEPDRLHAGTLVVQGDAVARVTATGVHTLLGRIGKSLETLRPRASRLHTELKRLVRRVAMLALLLCVLAAAVFAWRQGSWTGGVLVGLTLAMAIVPEEFAVVWTVMLALGAWRLAQLKVLTRQPQAIEALGTTTVLCVDKTGTLTCNRMEVVALHDGEQELQRSAGDALPPHFEPLLQAAALASAREGPDPMDKAVFRLLPGGSELRDGALQRREGVAPDRPYVLQCWRAGGERVIAIKGAPEAVLARCTDTPRVHRLAAESAGWAARGLRVIAVARWHGPDGAELPGQGYEAVGIVGFADPLREDVPAALQECRRAGVRVVMITGDSPITALAIATAAGFVPGETDGTAVLTGRQLDAMTDPQFDQAAGSVAVFARVTPAQKLRIVQALQRRGEVVAMTGDGVNDGPALRAADIGVAMGERGTDVAREAAALVLLDDRFASLVDAVRAGRRIFVNLRKAMGYLFAVHVPIVGVSLLPLLGGPLLLLPLHVVLLELIIDPACSLVFEAEPSPDDAMRQPPRPAQTALFDARAVARALTVGATALVAVAAVQWVGHRAGWPDETLRLAALTSIIVANLAMLWWFRTGFTARQHTNRIFDALLLGVSLFYGAVLLVHPLSAAFGFPTSVEPHWIAVGLAVTAGWSAWRLARGRGGRRSG